MGLLGLGSVGPAGMWGAPVPEMRTRQSTGDARKQHQKHTTHTKLNEKQNQSTAPLAIYRCRHVLAQNAGGGANCKATGPRSQKASARECFCPTKTATEHTGNPTNDPCEAASEHGSQNQNPCLMQPMARAQNIPDEPSPDEAPRKNEASHKTNPETCIRQCPALELPSTEKGRDKT